MFKALAITILRVYKGSLSRLLAKLGVRCRFHPTCSTYAVLAIEKHGAWMGVRKTWQRLLRCRPDNFDSCIDYP